MMNSRLPLTRADKILAMNQQKMLNDTKRLRQAPARFSDYVSSPSGKHYCKTVLADENVETHSNVNSK